VLNNRLVPSTLSNVKQTSISDGHAPEHLIRDNAAKCRSYFMTIIAGTGTEVLRTPLD
jgi:hypothetical protein